MVDSRDRVFDRVWVDFLVRGGATISWRLSPLFRDPQPYHCRVQVGDAGVPSFDAWEYADAGPSLNTFQYVDAARRGYGKHRSVYYRVELETPSRVYYSRPASAAGVLPKHDWLIARELVRQNRLLMDRATSVKGWLLKRRWAGTTPDPKNTSIAVTDPLDSSVVRSNDATVGTAFVGGYYAPHPYELEVSPTSHRAMLDASRGNVDDANRAIAGRAIMVPELDTEDVFVCDGSDRRYYVQRVTHTAEWRGVPLLADVELRPAVANDVIYSIAMPG
jgi:hypothetical protein